MPAGVQKGFSRTLISSSSTPEPNKSGLGADLGDGKGRTLFAGSWNADIYPPLKELVREGDVHCAKNVSGYFLGLKCALGCCFGGLFSSLHMILSRGQWCYFTLRICV